MNLLLPYILGVATPFIAWFVYVCYQLLQDAKVNLRYRRAWFKFTAEWHAMPMGQQTDFLANRPDYEPKYCDGQSAWFAHRWNGGHTKEI